MLLVVKVLIILVLYYKSFIFTCYFCFLFRKLFNLHLKELKFFLLFSATSYSTFSILETFSSFLVHNWVIVVVVNSGLVFDGLLHVLLPFLRHIAVHSQVII